jgi:hypothetical protein
MLVVFAFFKEHTHGSALALPLPKDEVMRLKWLRAIPRHDFNITNYSAVSIIIIIIGIIILYYCLCGYV